mgnify:CR=1 FL=1
MSIRGLFFDLGGTLFSYSGDIGREGVMHAVEALAIDAEPPDIGQAWRAASQEAAAEYAAKSYFLHSELFRATLDRFAARFDRETSDALAESFHARQREAVVANLPIRDDCHSTLQSLKDRGLYLSIVSNIDDDYLDPLVAMHGLDDVLHDWTSSEEARSCKPDRGIFHYALRKSGLSVDEVLFVGDSLHHDEIGRAHV